jgi:hypothetical protein
VALAHRRRVGAAPRLGICFARRLRNGFPSLDAAVWAPYVAKLIGVLSKELKGLGHVRLSS